MNTKLIETLASLQSESQNTATLNIDLVTTEELVGLINQQDFLVAEAIKAILPQLSEVVDAVVAAFLQGGRLIYLGAGTSGRLGVLDAVECVPTFGVEEGQVIGLLAGGEKAMFKAVEGAEDNPEQAALDLKSIELCAKDLVVGIAASGRTPYVVGGLGFARQIGAKTVAISSNANAEIARLSDWALLPQVGPEVIAGSTRMKSGSAQKMLLNILSTASMIKLGKTYQNQMVDLKATNQKLKARSLRLVMQITGVELSEAEQVLLAANGHCKLAILMLLADIDAPTAEWRLNQAGGVLRRALSTAAT